MNRRIWLSILTAGIVLSASIALFLISSTRPREVDTRAAPSDTQKHLRSNELGIASQETTRKTGSTKPTVAQKSEITPDEARRLLAEHRGIRDTNLRAKACFDVIEALCRAGYASEAFALIDVEASQVRRWELQALFRNSGWSLDEATQKMKLLVDSGYRGDGTSALSAYCSSLSLTDLQVAIKSPAMKEYVAYLKQHSDSTFDPLANALSTYLGGKILNTNSESDRATHWNAALQLHQEGIIDDSSFVDILKVNTSLSTFEKWQVFANSIKDQSEDSFVAEVRDRIVSSMVNQDVEAALGEITKSESPQASAALSTAIQQWLLNEGAGKVSEWYGANKDVLPSSHRDAVAESLLRSALAFGERDAALQWTNEIQNPQLKAENLARIENWDKNRSK